MPASATGMTDPHLRGKSTKREAARSVHRSGLQEPSNSNREMESPSPSLADGTPFRFRIHYFWRSCSTAATGAFQSHSRATLLLRFYCSPCETLLPHKALLPQSALDP